MKIEISKREFIAGLGASAIGSVVPIKPFRSEFLNVEFDPELLRPLRPLAYSFAMTKEIYAANILNRSES